MEPDSCRHKTIKTSRRRKISKKKKKIATIEIEPSKTLS